MLYYCHFGIEPDQSKTFIVKAKSIQQALQLAKGMFPTDKRVLFMMASVSSKDDPE